MPRCVTWAMRQGVKFVHTVSACGLIGALLGHMLILWHAPQANIEQYATLRETISQIARFILVPSLGVSLVTGLVALLVHNPYQSKRWVWVKAVMGFLMFESTLAVTQSKAVAAAEFASRIARGENVTETQRLLSEAIQSEWTVLYALMALSLAQTALGVWRPKLNFEWPRAKD